MLRLITSAPIGRICTTCGTDPGDEPMCRLLLAGWRVLRTGALLCPPCARRSDCASSGHLPTVPTPCGCLTTPNHPRGLTGRCSVLVSVCRHCGETVAPSRTATGVVLKAVA